MRIGLLGGSFNPAHQGHAHVAERARRLLRLDQVWLLVSPGNPLKPPRGMAPFADRLASARRIADGRRVIATGIEAALGTRYTVDTIRALRKRFPCAHFVWLMGADNLVQLPRWWRWLDIVRAVAIAVMPRPSYNHRALSGQAARRMRWARLSAGEATVLADREPPAWVFLPTEENTTSATAIRAEQKERSHRQKATRATRASRSARPSAPDAGAQAGPPGAAAGRQNAGNTAQEGFGSRPAHRSAANPART